MLEEQERRLSRADREVLLDAPLMAVAQLAGELSLKFEPVWHRSQSDYVRL